MATQPVEMRIDSLPSMNEEEGIPNASFNGQRRSEKSSEKCVERSCTLNVAPLFIRPSWN